jgi:hypothetical protein
MHCDSRWPHGITDALLLPSSAFHCPSAAASELLDVLMGGECSGRVTGAVEGRLAGRRCWSTACVGVAPALGESRERCRLAHSEVTVEAIGICKVSADDCHLMEETYRRYHQLATFICNRRNVCGDTYMC